MRLRKIIRQIEASVDMLLSAIEALMFRLGEKVL